MVPPGRCRRAERFRRLPIAPRHRRADDGPVAVDAPTLTVCPDRLVPADPDERAVARRLEHRHGEEDAAETVIDLVSGCRREVFML